jgi:hypothetical protein
MRERRRDSLPITFAARAVFLAAVLATLCAGIAGGLARAGVWLPLFESAWAGRAVSAHALLMISGFLGTVIGLERAVAVKRRAAFVAPLCSSFAGLCALAGAASWAAWLAALAAAVFTGVNVLVVSRQRAAHTAVLLGGACAWLVGTLLDALGARSDAVLPWLLSFLVLTIAAERLEMARLMRHRKGALASLLALLAALLLAAAACSFSARWGGLVFGLALMGLASWLLSFDIARRTVFARGLSRYMAMCLLLGYAWLAVSGAAWVGMSFGYGARDAALHALALGFVLSMVMGHAPVILPALTRIKLHYSRWFYLPLVLLHASLVARLAWGSLDAQWKARGAVANVAAIVLFALTMAGAALAWRARHATPRTRERAS